MGTTTGKSSVFPPDPACSRAADCLPCGDDMSFSFSGPKRVGAQLLLVLIGVAPLAATAAMYDGPAEGSDIIGRVQHIKTKESDTFVDLARQYDVGYRELRLANP